MSKLSLCCAQEKTPSSVSCRFEPDPAQILIDQLAIIIKGHYDSIALQEDQELDRLRAEVQRLQAVVREQGVEESANAISILDKSVKQPVQQEGVISADVEGKQLSEEGLPRQSVISADKEGKQLSEEGLPRQISNGLEEGEGVEADGELVKFATRSNLRALESDEAEVMELKAKFHELDPANKGYIHINVLLHRMTDDLHDEEKQEKKVQYQVAIQRVNKHLGMSKHISPTEKQTKQHIKFPTFKVMMLDDAGNLRQTYGLKAADTLLEMREALVGDVMMEKVKIALHVNLNESSQNEDTVQRKSRLLKILEPTVAAVILLNSLTLGLSLDWYPSWDGWFIIEACFTCFFVAEMLIMLHAQGWVAHFFGEDWAWNWFDGLIVLSAIVDTIITVASRNDSELKDKFNLNSLLVLRLVRIIRVTRLVRILRLKMFKELTLMVNGVIAGLRTLFWAIVLLTIFIYALGVLMRQLMINDMECVVTQTCNRGEKTLEAYGSVLFGSVGRSMLAIFNCFTDGCSSPDGTPLIWHLWDANGPFLVLGYVASFLFISFGVLNLILAVFVENTMSNAQRDDAQRQFGEQSNHAKKALQLQKILVKLCTSYSDAGLDNVFSKRSQSKGLVKLYRQASDWWKADSKERGGELFRGLPHLNMRITQDQFEEMLGDVEVNNMLDDLDISLISREQLFDILDADGNGFLAISELVDGILKLRGPADKGDGVASLLMIRQLQKQVSKIENYMREHIKKLADQPYKEFV